MNPIIFCSYEPHGVLALQLLSNQDGLSVGEIKQHLGIPLEIKQGIFGDFPISNPEKQEWIYATSDIEGLVHGLVTPNQDLKNARSKRFLTGTSIFGTKLDNSSRLFLTAKGHELLAKCQGLVNKFLRFIYENEPCLEQDADRRWNDVLAESDNLVRDCFARTIICLWLERRSLLESEGQSLKLRDIGKAKIRTAPKGSEIVEKNMNALGVLILSLQNPPK